MRLGYQVPFPDREDLRVGENCAECGCQLKEPYTRLDEPCPECGAWLRRLPRRRGQAVADFIDARDRA